MVHDVFISYSSKDEAHALALARALEAEGLACWVASRDIKAGANYDEAIIEAIEGAGSMVVVLSANTKDATGVDDEVRNARELKITIRPVRIEKVELSRALRFHLKGPQFLDAFDADGSVHFDRVAEKLARAIKPDVVGSNALAQGNAADAAQPKPHSARERRLIVVAAGVVLAVSLATVGIWKWAGSSASSGPPASRDSTARRSRADSLGIVRESTAGRSMTPATFPSTHAPLEVRVLDVGQGDATLIENGSGRVLIDGGASAQRLGHLLDSLSLNNSTFYLVVLSHEHVDHFGGLSALFESQRHIKIRYFFENKDPAPAFTLSRLRDSIRARESRGELIYRDTDDPCANGESICTFALAGGATLHILRPMPATSNANNRSVAIKLLGPDSATFSMWLAGDAEKEEIAWFLDTAHYDRNPGMHVDVLKADHHGSCNGVTEAYLGATRPRLVIASVARINPFRQMSSQIKEFFSANKIPWYRTDENGTVTLASTGVADAAFNVRTQKTLATSLNGPNDTSSGIECP